MGRRAGNEEEEATQLANVVPFLLESKLTERGAKQVGGLFEPHVKVAERLAEAGVPASAKGAGEEVVKLLAAQAFNFAILGPAFYHHQSKSMMFPKLQFVYNAKTGFFHKLADFAHKALSPATYNCNLCALTYGTFTMQQEWADYISSLPIEKEFVYRDEWEFHKSHRQYPLIALQTGEREIELLLNAEQINQLKNLQELKAAVSAALQKHHTT